jgi:hypothetical protein
MKKVVIVIAIFAVSTVNLNAQISIDKFKKKVTEDVKVTNKDNSTDTKTTPSKKVDVESSPAAKSIRKYRNALSFAKDAVNAGNNDAKERVESLEPMLAKIKVEDPNWADYDKDEADYLSLKKQFDKDDEKKSAYDKLERVNSAITFSEHKSIIALLDDAKILNLNNYELVKAYYDKHSEESTDYVKKTVARMNDFFANVFPTKRLDIIKAIDYTIKNTEKFIKENREKSTYLSQKDVSFYYPKGDINTIDKMISNFDNAFIMFPDEIEFKNRKEKLIARKSDLENYISSGDLKKDIEKRELMNIEERRISSPANTNPQLIAVVKRDLNVASIGSILRVSIVDRDWFIIKNNIDIPVSKKMEVECATKKDGKCYKVYGYLKCVYEGGGKYSNPQFSSYGDLREMNCENVNK